MITQKTAFRAEVFAKSNVGSTEQRQTLIDEIQQRKAVSPSMENSNPGCYRIEHPSENIDWLFEEINVLLTEAVNFYVGQDAIYASIPKSNNAVINYWANVNQPGSRNTFHTHKDDEFSCVYYLQGTDSGDLRFPNPANVLGDCNKRAPFARDFSFAPQDGDLILFPSWMPHEVEPNLSNRERINIAFNFRISK